MIRSNEVHLTMSPEKYRALIEMIEVADWIIASRETEACESTAIFREVRKAVLANAEDAGMGGQIVYEEKYDEFYETFEYEQAAVHREIIDEYDHHTFWEQLVDHLAQRDLVEEFGKEGAATLSVEERIGFLGPREEFYHHEFVERGLMNLRLIEQKS